MNNTPEEYTEPSPDMKVMITGASGFIGGILTKYALDRGATVLGIDSKPAPAGYRADFEQCDVRDANRLKELVDSFRPTCVFHLAAQSYPTVSLSNPLETMEINAGGTINMFESVRTVGLAPMIVVACSSAEYGSVDAADLPVQENYPLRPLHPYGVSKVSQDLLASQYFANYSIPCVRIRIFNTTGPGKIGDVCSDLARRLAEMELGLRSPVLPVGNLSTRRAILDAHDLVNALWLSATRCEPGEAYNVCAAETHSVEELIEMFRLHTTVPFVTERDPGLVRRCDEPVILGDSSRFQRATGWRPTHALQNTVQEMLAWWRERLCSELAAQRFSSHPQPDAEGAILITV
jgi:GDP-4-dehydro-6-deoxy-D-mannose reductase